MNERDSDNKIENILRKVHIPEPTPLLKERITTEAIKTWNESSGEIPWQIPVRRLAASAAAAVLIISIANFSSNHALKNWHPEDAQVTREQLPDFEILPDMPYRPFVRHLGSLNRRSFKPDTSALHNYAERVRQILKETQQNGGSNGQMLDGGRSRLFPVKSSSDYYS